jgi:hypothetical protein
MLENKPKLLLFFLCDPLHFLRMVLFPLAILRLLSPDCPQPARLLFEPQWTGGSPRFKKVFAAGLKPNNAGVVGVSA